MHLRLGAFSATKERTIIGFYHVAVEKYQQELVKFTHNEWIGLFP